MGTTASPWRYDAASASAENCSNVVIPSRKHYAESARSRLSYHLQGRNSVDLLSKRLLGPLQVVALLQIEPQVRTISAQLPEPQRHHRCYWLLFLKDVIERLTRYAEQLGDLRLGAIQRRQNLFAQKFAGMHGRQAALRELLGHRAFLSDNLPDRRRLHHLPTSRM